MNAPSTRSTTLVIGGTGKTGRRVSDRLTALGHRVRVGSRGSEPPFRWEDQGTWAAALDGVDRAYIVHPEVATATAQEQITRLVRQATSSGVQRIVLLSGRGRIPVEESISSSGVSWTVVRPNWFNQNFGEGFFLDAVRGGDLVLPVGSAAEAFVDADDIADVVVAALTGDGHDGRIYELSGPRPLTLADVAEELSRATGREITYTPVDVEQYRALLRENGLPEEMADYFAHTLTGEHAEPTRGVEEALGRPARDFADYARDAAATGVWSA